MKKLSYGKKFHDITKSKINAGFIWCGSLYTLECVLIKTNLLMETHKMDVYTQYFVFLRKLYSYTWWVSILRTYYLQSMPSLGQT